MNGDRLTELETLIEVADSGSFTAAAKKLGITQSAISRRIMSLERRFGGRRLIARTTRHTHLTEVGERYLGIARAAVDQLRFAGQLVLEDESQPEGLVRISVPPAFGRALLVPALHSLSQVHDKLQFDVDFSQRYADFVEDHLDLAIRTRPIEQSGVKTKRIVTTPLVAVFASTSPGLSRNRLVVQRPRSDVARSQIDRFLKLLKLSEVAPIRSDDIDCLRKLAIQGHGVAVLPRLLVEEDLKMDRLQIFDEKLDLTKVSLFAQYPYEMEPSAKLQTTLLALEQAVQKV